MKSKGIAKYLVIGALVVLAAGGAFLWRSNQVAGLPPGIASGNGRLEATEVDIATKQQGRVEAVLVKEGDMVEQGQVLARMDAAVLQAQLREAEADKLKAETDRAVVVAVVGQRENEYGLAAKILARTQNLYAQKIIDENQLDKDKSAEQTARTIVTASKAQVASADAAIQSAAAKMEKIKADIADTVLKSPRSGRVEYRLVEPGEVIPAGGKVVTLLDVTDVYMTFFLPTMEAGKVAIGGDARILLDAVPDQAIPAKVSFVSPTAQFTPKEVETRSEREKLMFRVKVRIDPDLLKPWADRVKTGLPGTGFVKLNPTAEWPENLKTRMDKGLPPMKPEELK